MPPKYRPPGVILFSAIALLAIFFICCDGKVSEPGDESPMTEGERVQQAVSTTLFRTHPPIRNLETDYRIAGYASSEAKATNTMTDGGLIDFVDIYVNSGSVSSPAVYLGRDTTDSEYWLDYNGRVYEAE